MYPDENKIFGDAVTVVPPPPVLPPEPLPALESGVTPPPLQPARLANDIDKIVREINLWVNLPIERLLTMIVSVLIIL